MLLPCPKCAALVDAIQLAEHGFGDDGGAPELAVFCHCPSCESPLLAIQSCRGIDAGEAVWSAPMRVYPPSPYADRSLPKAVRDSLVEARTCLDAGAATACVMMCRRTIELVCEHHGTHASKDLHKKIEALHAAKVIDDRLREWAHVLRIKGNAAAHEAALLSAQDASDLVDFTHAIAEYVFVLTAKFESFKARRAARAAEASDDNA